MIEYKFEGKDWAQSAKLSRRSAEERLFFDYKIRIADVIYESNTPEFKEAYEKEQSWEILRGNKK